MKELGITINQLKLGTVLSYVALFLNIGISIVYTPYVLKTLGRSEYGLFSLVNSTIAYLTVLDFGFGNAMIRYTVKFRVEHKFEKAAAMNGMFFLLFSGIGLVAFFLGLLLVFNVGKVFGRSLNSGELELVGVLLCLAVINIALTFPFSIFSSLIQAYERFVFIQAARLFRLVVNPLLMVTVLALGYRSIGIIVGTTVLNIIFNLINLVYCFKKLKVRLKFGDYDLVLLKEIAGYSFFIFLNIVVDRIYWSTGQFLLGIFTGTAAISVFAIAVQINMYYMQLSAAMSTVFLPKVTAISMQSNDSGQLSELFIKVGRLQFFITAAALSGFVILGKRFIILWAGLDYSLSYYIALILLVVTTVPLIQNLGITILQAKNRQAFRSVLYFGIAIINIIISIPLIKVWGALGCAVGTALGMIAGHIMTMNIYYYKCLKLDIPLFWLEIVKMLPAVMLPSGLGLILIYRFPLEGPLGFLIHGGAFLIMYGLCMWFLGFNRFEKALVSTPLQQIAVRVKSRTPTKIT